MKITKYVQFLVSEITNNNLFRYDFLDLESNLPFSIYSTEEIPSYNELQQYVPLNVDFELKLSKVTDSKGNQKIAWKVKGC